MIKAVLVDDEKNALEMMEWLLKTYCPQVEIQAMCSSAEAGIAAILVQKQVLLLFMNIRPMWFSWI